MADVPDLPDDVTRGLDDFVAGARQALGDALVSVVLYGSAAEGALRATSDVNVIIVLARFDRHAAERLREPLRVAQAAVRLAAMLVLRDELPDVVAAFAQKFADVVRRRRVLHGEDPFAGLRVPRAALTAQLDQVLLNLTLRLRAAFVERGLREEQLAIVVAEAAGPLRACAASVLELEGAGAVVPKEALRLVTATLGEAGWDVVLERLSRARQTRLLAPGEAAETVLRLVDLAGHLRARVRTVRA